MFCFPFEILTFLLSFLPSPYKKPTLPSACKLWTMRWMFGRCSLDLWITQTCVQHNGGYVLEEVAEFDTLPCQRMYYTAPFESLWEGWEFAYFGGQARISYRPLPFLHPPLSRLGSVNGTWSSSGSLTHLYCPRETGKLFLSPPNINFSHPPPSLATCHPPLHRLIGAMPSHRECARPCTSDCHAELTRIRSDRHADRVLTPVISDWQRERNARERRAPVNMWMDSLQWQRSYRGQFVVCNWLQSMEISRIEELYFYENFWEHYPNSWILVSFSSTTGA